MDLRLRMADGALVRWTDDRALAADSTEAYDLSAHPPQFGGRGVGLLTVYVRYDGEDGRHSAPLGLEGRFVHVGETGMTPSAERFSAVMGVGLIQDPHDEVDIDRDLAAADEVAR